jgi:hypothetical protein
MFLAGLGWGIARRVAGLNCEACLSVQRVPAQTESGDMENQIGATQFVGGDGPPLRKQ